MDLADELQKLKVMHDTGSLRDEEFAQAKGVLLAEQSDRYRAPEHAPEPGTSLGNVANKWVNLQIVLAVVGLIVAAIFFFAFWLPQWNRVNSGGFP
jgi:hypothetical protein